MILIFTLAPGVQKYYTITEKQGFILCRDGEEPEPKNPEVPINMSSQGIQVQKHVIQ